MLRQKRYALCTGLEVIGIFTRPYSTGLPGETGEMFGRSEGYAMTFLKMRVTAMREEYC